MIIKLDFQSEIPIYQQLYQEIIKGIATKEFLPGDPLPSVRILSQDLGINLHTVNKTYNLLKQEGYVQIHRQKGVEITTEAMPAISEEFLNRLDETLKPIIAEAMVRGMSKEDFVSRCNAVFDQYNQSGGNES